MKKNQSVDYNKKKHHVVNTRINMILDIINDDNLCSSRSNFNLLAKPVYKRKIDNRSPTSKLLDLNLLSDLTSIIKEYNKQADTIDQLQEQWQNERFPSLHSSLRSKTDNSDQLNQGLYQYYFNVNNIVHPDNKHPNVYIIKAGTRLFCHSIEVHDSKTLEKNKQLEVKEMNRASEMGLRDKNLLLKDIHNNKLRFFFSPIMVESSVNELSNKNRGYYFPRPQFGEGYQDYYITEYVVTEDLKVFFSIILTKDFESKICDKTKDFDGDLILSKFYIPDIKNFENFSQNTAKNTLKKSTNFKMMYLSLTKNLKTVGGEITVTIPNLIICDPDNLKFVASYKINTKHLIDRYINESDQILTDIINNQEISYTNEDTAFGPKNKLID